jgi:hypothetical protein
MIWSVDFVNFCRKHIITICIYIYIYIYTHTHVLIYTLGVE